MEYEAWEMQWEAVVKKAFDDYTSLTSDERIWFNVMGLIGAVTNGGIISYYYNSGADYMEETLEDLKALGANDVVKIVNSINKLFPGGKPSKNQDERNVVIDSWDDGRYEHIFERNDDKFYDLQEKLEKKLESIIKKIL